MSASRLSPVSRRDFLSTTALAALAAGCAGPRNLAGGARRPPNFVVIFTDDQGYQDLGCFGSPDIKTPRIDRMAAEGLRFTDFHTAASVCTPSRAGLLTGCYPQRVSLPFVLFPHDNTGLSGDEITLAELLRDRGYATACIGKWHLGHHSPFLPRRHGFDLYFGLPYSNDMRPENKARVYPPLPLLWNDEVVEEDPDQRLLSERYTAAAVRFIEANAHRPFFLYLPHTMPHVPLYASERFAGKSQRGLYGDVIETLDWCTGEILDALARLGLDETTLVLFTSDNGPWLSQRRQGGSALPLRDGKGTVYEGGHRVPTVMRWPGAMPAGGTCDEFCSTLDLLPTFAALAGGRAPRDRIIDGKDIRPLLHGAPGARTPHEVFYHYGGWALRGVRAGDWKLVLPGVRVVDGRRVRTEEELYNLREDLSESTNLVGRHPEMAARLREYAEAARADLGDSLLERTGSNRRPCGVLGA